MQATIPTPSPMILLSCASRFTLESTRKTSYNNPTLAWKASHITIFSFLVIKDPEENTMVRFGLICFFLSLIMVIQATAGQAENNPFERRLQSGRDPTGSSSSQSDPEYSRVQAEAPAPYRRLGGHHSPDKSVAGGGVIIGGLVTAIFAAVFCYIRVTRKRDGDHQVGH